MVATGDFPSNCRICGGLIGETPAGRTWTGGAPHICNCGVEDKGIYNLYGDLVITPTKVAKLLTEKDIIKQKVDETNHTVKDTQYYDLINDIHNVCEKYGFDLIGCNVDKNDENLFITLMAKIELQKLYKKQKETAGEIL